MVALTDKPEQTAAAIRAAGGTPYIVKTGVPGLEVKVREKKPVNQGKKKNPRKSKRDEPSE